MNSLSPIFLSGNCAPH